MAVSQEVIELSRLLDSRFAAEEISLDDRVSQSHSATTSLHPVDRITTDSSQDLLDANDTNDHPSSIAKVYDVSVNPVAEKEDLDHRYVHHTPWALRRSHLICLMIILVLMIVALEVTQYLSIKNQGLATTTQRIQYIWTYGPTAGNVHARHTPDLRLITISVLYPRNILGCSRVPNESHHALEANGR